MKIKSIDGAYAILDGSCDLSRCRTRSENCSKVHALLGDMPKTPFCARQLLHLNLLFPYCYAVAEQLEANAELLPDDVRKIASTAKTICDHFHAIGRQQDGKPALLDGVVRALQEEETE